VETIARTGEGVPTLIDAINAHATWLATDGRMPERLRRSAEARIKEIAKDLLLQRASDPAHRRGAVFQHPA
jgi:putative protein kinase ArgK-like GTPase of G3E family